MGLCVNMKNSVINIYHHHHHQDMPTAWILWNLFCHPSLSAITFSKSSWRHSVSAYSWCVSMYRSQQENIAMSLSLLLVQRRAGFVCLTWTAYHMRSKWLYSCCFEGCCFMDLLKTAHCIFASLSSSIFLGVLFGSSCCSHTVVLTQVRRIPNSWLN